MASIDVGVFLPEIPKTPVCGGSRTIQMYMKKLCDKYNVRFFICTSNKLPKDEIKTRIDNFNELTNKKYEVYSIDEFDKSLKY